MKKTIVYFTDSRLEEELDYAVRKQLLKAAKGIPIISVTQKPVDFGKNICVGFKPRCYLSLYEQLLIGLRAADEDSIIYLCEHDVFYHPGYFDYVPALKDKIYYNLHRYYAMRNKNHFLKSVGKRALSQAVAYREVLIEHAMRQIHNRRLNVPSPCVGPFLNYDAEFANIDMRHGGNFTTFCNFDNPEKDPRLFSSVDYWGTPDEFKSRVGLEDKDINTATYLSDMFPSKKEFTRNDLAVLFGALQFKKGAEIGVKFGRFSKVLCVKNPGVRLKCIDAWTATDKFGWDKQESAFGSAIKYLLPFDVEIIRKTSMQAAAEDVPKWSLDFVYIDADHTFKHVMQDIIAWSDRVRPGGIVSGDDYQMPDIKTAVDAYASVHDYKVFLTDNDGIRVSWFFAKP